MHVSTRYLEGTRIPIRAIYGRLSLRSRAEMSRKGAAMTLTMDLTPEQQKALEEEAAARAVSICKSSCDCVSWSDNMNLSSSLSAVACRLARTLTVALVLCPGSGMARPVLAQAAKSPE